MVLGVVGALAGLVKTQSSSTKVDSRIFRLHYHLTTAFLFGSAAFLAATEYFGDPIQCSNDADGKDQRAITTFCWIAGVFTLNTKGSDGSPQLYKSHGSDFSGLGNSKGFEQRFHSYYQWVPIVLFIQGCLFYVPHYLWKINEGHHIKSLLQGLEFVKLNEDCNERITKISKYILSSSGKNRKYYVLYSFFEILNLVNVLGQIWFMDIFFSGAFRNLGADLLSDKFVSDEDRRDPLITIFPRITKCDFTKFGSSGTIVNIDSICLLPLNMLNEKIFVVLWFWFILLSVITSLRIILIGIQFVSMKARLYLFDSKGKISSRTEVRVMVENLSNGEYFLLNHIRYNLAFSIFEKLLTEMATQKPIDTNDIEMLPTRMYDNNAIDTGIDTLDIKKRNLYGIVD